MLSRGSVRPSGLAPLLALGALVLAAGASAGADPAPTPESVRAAVAALRNDPNLGTQQTVRRLNWVDSNSPPPPNATPSPWLVNFFQYLGQGMRLLLWIGGAILLAVAAIWGYRLYRSRRPAGPAVRGVPPTHIGSLDIRPESLPEDIGAAALALLEAGRAREALSLLYRGSLSRAVHRFGVPIAASFTEAEALDAVSRSLEASRVDYLRALVFERRESVYAGRELVPATIADLCRRFAPALGGSAG